MRLAPDDAAAAAISALTLAASDRLTPALAESRRAVSADPKSADAHIALCTVLRLRKDDEEAIRSCRRAAEIAPHDVRVLTALGEALREAGRYDQASEMFGQAIDLDHEAILPQLGAAATLLKSGNYPMARGLLNVLLQKWDYGKSRARQGAAALLTLAQDYDAALQVYENLEVPKGASLPALLILYGKAYCLTRLERGAEAEYFLSSLIERVPSDYDGPARGREVLFRAYDDLLVYHRSKGRDRKMMALLRSACERPLVPTHLARALAERIETESPTDAGAVLERAILGSDPLEDSLELVDSTLKMVRLRTSGGTRRLAENSPAARALDLTTQRVAASPLGVTHYRLARALALAQRRDAAVKSLARARQSGYLPTDQMAGEPDFEKIRRDPAFETLLDSGEPAPAAGSPATAGTPPVP